MKFDVIAKCKIAVCLNVTRRRGRVGELINSMIWSLFTNQFILLKIYHTQLSLHSL